MMTSKLCFHCSYVGILNNFNTFFFTRLVISEYSKIFHLITFYGITFSHFSVTQSQTKEIIRRGEKLNNETLHSRVPGVRTEVFLHLDHLT